MALDASIYARFAPQQKSATEYASEFQALDNLRGQGQSNALQQLLLQGKVDQQGAAVRRSGALEQLQRSLAGRPEAELPQAYRDAGFVNEAGAIEKGMLERDNLRAKTDNEKAGTKKEEALTKKATIEATADRLKTYRTALDFVDTPAAAQRWLQAQYADPLLSEQMQALGPVDQAITRIPQDPASFEQWRGKAAMGMEGWMKQQLEQSKAGETQRHNKATEATARGNLSVAQQRESREAAAPRGQFIQTPDGYVLADPRTGSVSPVMGPDGKPLQGKAADRALTEGQAKANLFGNRMQEADRIITDLAGKGFASPSLAQQLTGGEGITGQVATAMASPQQQQIDQAQRDFINAVLRRESGAAIATSEFQNARKQYFVQPGDSKEVVAQKARNRQTAISGMLAEVPEGKRGAGKPAAPEATPSGFKFLGTE